MKIKEIEITDEEDDGRYACIQIEVNGKKRFSIGGGEPEDMCLSRDLSDAYFVTSLMKDAFDAGAAGKKWDYERVVAKSWDDLED